MIRLCAAEEEEYRRDGVEGRGSGDCHGEATGPERRLASLAYRGFSSALSTHIPRSAWRDRYCNLRRHACDYALPPGACSRSPWLPYTMISDGTCTLFLVSQKHVRWVGLIAPSCRGSLCRGMGAAHVSPAGWVPRMEVGKCGGAEVAIGRRAMPGMGMGVGAGIGG
jgi:hypothetical protein